MIGWRTGSELLSPPRKLFSGSGHWTKELWLVTNSGRFTIGKSFLAIAGLYKNRSTETWWDYCVVSTFNLHATRIPLIWPSQEANGTTTWMNNRLSHGQAIVGTDHLADGNLHMNHWFIWNHSLRLTWLSGSRDIQLHKVRIKLLILRIIPIKLLSIPPLKPMVHPAGVINQCILQLNNNINGALNSGIHKNDNKNNHQLPISFSTLGTWY